MQLSLAFTILAGVAYADQLELTRRLEVFAAEVEKQPPTQAEIDACLRDLRHGNPTVARAALDRLRTYAFTRPVDDLRLLPAVAPLTAMLSDPASRDAALFILNLISDTPDRAQVDALKTLAAGDNVRTRYLALLRLSRADEFHEEIADFFRTKLLDPQATEYRLLVLRAIREGMFFQHDLRVIVADFAISGDGALKREARATLARMDSAQPRP